MRDSAESILLVAPSLTGLGGGIELYLRQLTEALARLHPRARLTAVLAREATLQRPALLSEALRARLEVTGARSERRAIRIGELIVRAGLSARRVRPTMIVCGHVHYAALSRALARLFGARLVVMTYGVEAWSLASTATVAALRAADRVLTISAFTASQLMQSIDLPAARIGVVHNAVDTARFRPGRPRAEIEAKLAALPRPRLITVCRLDASEAYKGVDTVTRALAASPGLAGSYLVVGDGTDRPRLERLAADLGAPVTFYGRASDDNLADLYRACDLFVMPSRKEGFGYVFIEAMACGIPTVAGSVDGSVDALAGGALGLLVNPLDERELTGAIAAQLTGATPPQMRDPEHLHAEVARRFGVQAFGLRLQAALS